MRYIKIIITLFFCLTINANAKTIGAKRAVVSKTETPTWHFIESSIPKFTLEKLGEFTLTAYCSCEKCCGEYALNRPTDENGNEIVKTASGAIAKPNYTIAADTNVLPFGTKIRINGHTYEVQDRGGAIKGNRIDIYFADHESARKFGRQKKTIFLVKE